jgi:hypothetical protein
MTQSSNLRKEQSSIRACSPMSATENALVELIEDRQAFQTIRDQIGGVVARREISRSRPILIQHLCRRTGAMGSRSCPTTLGTACASLG